MGPDNVFHISNESKIVVSEEAASVIRWLFQALSCVCVCRTSWESHYHGEILHVEAHIPQSTFLPLGSSKERLQSLHSCHLGHQWWRACYYRRQCHSWPSHSPAGSLASRSLQEDCRSTRPSSLHLYFRASNISIIRALQLSSLWYYSSSNIKNKKGTNQQQIWRP